MRGDLRARLEVLRERGTATGELTPYVRQAIRRSAEELKRLGETLASRLTYLLEPIGAVEFDPEGCVVQLRSIPPHKDDDKSSYYELLARRAKAFGMRIMGIDPGIRTGCKIAVVDATGKLLDTATIYPHAPRNDRAGALTIITRLAAKHGVDLVGVGNGTADVGVGDGSGVAVAVGIGIGGTYTPKLTNEASVDSESSVSV